MLLLPRYTTHVLLAVSVSRKGFIAIFCKITEDYHQATNIHNKSQRFGLIVHTFMQK